MVKLVNRKYNIYLIAALGSIAISILTLLYRQPIDVDGIIYLQAATAFLHGGFVASFHVYQWPLYSILIAICSKTLHLSLLNTGQLLNIVFDLGTVCAFIAIIKELGGSRKLQLLGALLILTLPYFNHFRPDILRDHGYYAFALLAIMLLIRFAKTRYWRYAITWSIAMLIAGLFRIEGMILFVTLPLILLFNSEQRLITTLKAYILQIVIIILLIILFTAGLSSQQLGLLQELFTSGPGHFLVILHTKHHLTTTHIIGQGTLESVQATYFIAGGIIGDIIGMLLRTLGLLYIILAIYTVSKKLLPWEQLSVKIWLFTIIVNIIIVLLFLINNFFLSERYLGLLYFLILLAVPFAIQKLYHNWKLHQSHSRWLFILVLIALVYTMIAGIGHFGPSKSYIVDSGNWLHTNMPATAKVCTNDKQLFYYAGERGLIIPNTRQLLTQYTTKNCDYLAVKIDRHTPKELKQLAQTLPVKATKTFSNSRGDMAVIFTIKKHHAT